MTLRIYARTAIMPKKGQILFYGLQLVSLPGSCKNNSELSLGYGINSGNMVKQSDHLPSQCFMSGSCASE